MAETISSNEFRQLLSGARGGDELAGERLLELVYVELKGLAARALRGQRRNHTLQNTALVHEAWLRISKRAPTDWRDRAHFLNASAQAMRRVLVDHARRRDAYKRPMAERLRVVFREDLQLGDEDGVDLVDVDDTLRKLEALDERQARIVELRALAGMTIKEIAAVLEASESTIKTEWRLARAWLRRELGR
ncbi:MAG: ECF-type sigma factor [Planctomycetota bacterium]|jgi:RNA polymerase sigma factor (TIGR02999 family)|nr:ECF-type sigma factor [Planctomycetota bacterium]MDP6761882.1 ECF-type sigma factor [Planctomycetota bacterium]MDP6987954.1 ECF-type sigma factor [Planctomycetota bacterium]